MKSPAAQLSAKRLAGQLGARGDMAPAIVGSLYSALTVSGSTLGQEAFDCWKDQLSGGLRL